jgi:catechol 2,3-dioxygenase-like lactoylglutathione lyase family enzyme
MDIKIELIALPVTDVDRARDFYAKVGFTIDHDHRVSPDLRFVQLTPPGSACSICIGEGITGAPPGSVEGVQAVIADADVAHADLTAKGIEISPIDDQAWGRFIYFADPDGNRWALQQIVVPDAS